MSVVLLCSREHVFVRISRPSQEVPRFLGAKCYCIVAERLGARFHSLHPLLLIVGSLVVDLTVRNQFELILLVLIIALVDEMVVLGDEIVWVFKLPFLCEISSGPTLLTSRGGFFLFVAIKSAPFMSLETMSSF